MKAIAERAGVSMMTVSRALRNEGRISGRTRDRILRIADELGYRPNPLVAALMADLRRVRPRGCRTQTLAFVTSHETSDGWRNEFTPASLYEGARRRADRLGFDLVPFWTKEPEMPATRLSQILRTRAISGALIAPYPVPPAGAVNLDWKNMATVALGYSVREPQVHRVTTHSLHSIRMAIAELSRRGYSRIGLAVSAGDNERVDGNWATGFAAFQAKLRFRERVPVYLPVEPDREAYRRWRERFRPDAILGGAFALKWLREEGARIPDEVGFATVSYFSDMGDVAGILPNHEAVGAAAVELLVEQLYHNERGIPETRRIVMVEGRWREGRSLREA